LVAVNRVDDADDGIVDDVGDDDSDDGDGNCDGGDRDCGDDSQVVMMVIIQIWWLY
jgi:hypothetical protein